MQGVPISSEGGALVVTLVPEGETSRALTTLPPPWTPEEGRELARQVKFQLRFVDFAPVRRISASTGRGTHKLLQAVDELARQRRHRVATAELNRFFERVVEHHDPPRYRGRDVKFNYIAQIRQEFEQEGLPYVSVDTKKRELVGHFKNPGAALGQQAILVNDHDFRSQAKGIAIPHGVYDIQANRATVCVGVSYDTSEFAVESIAKWWCEDSRSRYPHARELLILADSGGSNSSTRRTWKYALQTRLCDRYGLTVTVCHYPPGTSKWNPIEHRLLCPSGKHV